MTKRLSESMTRLSVCSVLVLFIISCPLLGNEGLAALALSSSEDRVLTKWKQTAAATTLGAELLQILNDCDRRLAINSLDGKASFRRGYLYGLLGCSYSAISDLSRALEMAPADGRAYTERGLCYMDLKLYDRALRDLNRALQLQPYSGNALLARARLLLITGKPKLAIADLLNCQNTKVQFTAELPGEYTANHYNAVSYYLGASYEALAHPDAAINYYKNSLTTSDQMTAGYLHRYAEQPTDTKLRIAKLENTTGGF